MNITADYVDVVKMTSIVKKYVMKANIVQDDTVLQMTFPIS